MTGGWYKHPKIIAAIILAIGGIVVALIEIVPDFTKKELEEKPIRSVAPQKTYEPGWYGFLNSENIDREAELHRKCSEHFTRIHVPYGTTCKDLCTSINMECTRVCDWEGNPKGCSDAPYSWGDGSRLCYCE